ncbi:MAG: tetratricopeptide repeat protein [Planctomycetota bacterium]
MADVRRDPGKGIAVVDYTKHIQKAEEAARRRNYDFAIQLFQQLLEIDPDVGEARAGLRRVLRKRHEAAKGGKLLKMLKGAGPLALGKTLIKAGKHAAAVKSLEAYLATNPLDEEGNLLLGMSLEAAKYYRSALAVYEFLAEIAPRNPAGLKRAGAMMRVSGDLAKALDYYERALESDPRDREALKARKDLAAEAAISRSRFDEVSHSREQMVDKEAAVKLERSQRLHRSPEELREELAQLEERFAEDASDVDLMLEMVEVHEKLRDPEAALDLARRALSYRKHSVDLETRIGQLELKALKKGISRADKAGDQDEADRLEGQLREKELAELRRRLELTPGDAGLRLTLGKALVRQERYDEAAAELQKAVPDPRLADEARVHLALCFQKKGFLDLARKEYQRALEARPEVDERAREILYNLGAIAEAEGESAEARGFYARIFEVDIGYRDVAQKMEGLR